MEMSKNILGSKECEVRQSQLKSYIDKTNKKNKRVRISVFVYFYQLKINLFRQYYYYVYLYDASA